MFKHLQNNQTFNCNYKSLENEITELKNNEIIDKKFKITSFIEESLNFPDEDVDITSENYDIRCFNTQSSQADERNDTAPSLSNNALTPNSQTVFLSDFKILFQSLEDKLNGKILAIKLNLLD